MEIFNEYLLFLAKTATIVVAVLIVLVGVTAAATSRQPGGRDRLQVRRLNERFEKMATTLRGAMAGKRMRSLGRLKKRRRPKRAARKPGERVFVLNFQGDMRASAVNALREEITAVLTVADKGDEVVVRLESAGGLVHGYGLAASQLVRLKQHGLRVTVTADKVAASGGYLMACVADRILAAPFAVVGSIGVISQLPNFHRLLQRHDIDYEMFTAGEFKRTVTMFGENTDKARAKHLQDVEDVHALFKQFIVEHRPALDIDRVATGEYWYGARALELKLVDELRTSDDYLVEQARSRDLYEVRYLVRKPIGARLSEMMASRNESGLPGLPGGVQPGG